MMGGIGAWELLILGVIIIFVIVIAIVAIIYFVIKKTK